MKANPILTGANHRRYIRSPTRMLSLLAAGLVPMFAMLGHALTAPASAAPGLTPDETTYVTLLARYRIVPAPGHTQWDLAQTGHQIAADVRASTATYPNPVADEQNALCLTYRFPDNTCMEWVSAAVVVFAPEQASRIPDMATWREAYQDAYNFVHRGPLFPLPVPYPSQ